VKRVSLIKGGGVLHRLVDIGDMRQKLVVDLDELQRLPCRAGIDSCDRSHGVAVIERLGARHAIVEDVVHGGIAIGEVRQIGGGDHRLHRRPAFPPSRCRSS